MKTMTLLFALLISSVVMAEGGRNGIGLVLGDPTGVTYQHQINAQRFMDFTLAYNFHHEEMMLMGDYKVRLPNLFDASVPVNPYIGGGLFFHIEGKDRAHKDDLVVGVRVPFGVDWKVPDSAFVLFGELAPGMSVIPSTDAELQGGIGGRYFF